MGDRNQLLSIQLTFLVGFSLTIMPISTNLSLINPQWLVLIVAYWGIYTPEKSGIVTAWIWGLLLDVALGTHMGIHALALALVAYMSVILHLRLRMYPMWQQIFFIWLLAGLDKLVTFQLMNVFSPIQADWDYWLSTFMTCLIWPLALISLKWFQRRRHF